MCTVSSLSQNRGIESFDLNQTVVLVQAPVEAVAQAFAKLKQTTVWKQNAYGQEVPAAEAGVLIFRFRDHCWTIITPAIRRLEEQPDVADARLLSAQLHTKALYYAASDTTGAIAYELFNDGQSREMMSISIDYSDDIISALQEGALEMEPSDLASFLDPEAYRQFRSELRSLTVDQIDDEYHFVETFCREQDAYIPGFTGDEWLTHQGTLKLDFQAYCRPDEVERLDFIAFNLPQPRR